MMMVQLFVEGHGEIDPAELHTAVTRAGDACPGSRQRRAGRQWVGSGIAPEMRVIEIGAAEPISMAHDPRLPPLRGDDGRRERRKAPRVFSGSATAHHTPARSMMGRPAVAS